MRLLHRFEQCLPTDQPPLFLCLQLQQKSTNQRNIFQALCKGVTTSALGVGQGKTLLLDTVPLLKRILSPQLRSVAVQLLSLK